MEFEKEKGSVIEIKMSSQGPNHIAHMVWVTWNGPRKGFELKM